MTNNMIANLRLIANKNIDKQKWDATVTAAKNGSPFAAAWCLDAVCGSRWDALVLGDYEWVCPLPYHRKKLFFKSLYQPLLVQKYGVYSQNDLTDDILHLFYTFIIDSYKSVYLHWAMQPEGVNLAERQNQILPLQANYEALHANFRRDHKTALKKVMRDFELVDYDVKSYLQLHENTILEEFDANKKQYTLLHERLITASLHQNIGHIIAIKSIVTQDILGAVFYIKTKNRIYIVSCCTTETGKKRRITRVLHEYLIQKYANSAFTLDFCGSMIAGIAEYNKGFGATDEPYFVLQKKLF